MCTALRLKPHCHYFGRTLDLDRSYGEEVCILPRRLPLVFRKREALPTHYAIIGMATVAAGQALLYDGVNEHGLAMAGLNFPGNACYYPERGDKENITPFELIPYLLGQCKTVREAKKRLQKINLTNISFGEGLPLSPLHWMICDREEAIVLETVAEGMQIYDNPVGVMTNNPPFPQQLFHLNNFRHLQVDNGSTPFSEALGLSSYCQGLGAVGLPGDVSSMSRFVRAVFGRENSVCDPEEGSSVSQFFRLLSSVEMNRGICRTPEGHWDISCYTSCMNTDRGLYYYSTYDNRCIHCVDLHREDLEGTSLQRFPLHTEPEIAFDN